MKLECRGRVMYLLSSVVALFLLACESFAEDRPAAPNIVLIFCDDLGYGDLGCYGAEGYATPNLDRLAAEGVRFTRFYTAQPVCSASRAALLTGCYPNRVGIQGALGPQAAIGISDSETTIAEMLKTRGYATAIYGKWHLGHHPKFLPTRHGFDEYFGLPYSNDMWPLHPDYLPKKPGEVNRKAGYPSLPLIEGDQVKITEVTSAEQRHLTTWYTEHAVDFIDRHRDQPFFLYVPHAMVHVPLFVSDKFEGKTARGLFGDVMQEVDWSVGEVLKALERNGIDDNTLVLFTSDNGPWLSYGKHAGSSGGLREGKGTAWEGGVREPFLARWPKQIPAGTVCNEPAMTIDLLPTIAKLTGAPLPELPIDGLDISSMLMDPASAKSPHDAYYFYYHDNELHAVMRGTWKLYLPHRYRTLAGREGRDDGRPIDYEQREVSTPELYDLSADAAETKNVAAENPAIVKELLEYAERARADLGDNLTQRPGPGRRPAGRL
jgi:arylsulfatase A